MDVKDFKVGSCKTGYEYAYFMPENINVLDTIFQIVIKLG